MNGDIMLLARLYKSNTEEAIEWIRNHPNDKSIAVTSKVKKIYYGYGGRGTESTEYDINIKSDGIYIRNGKGADTNKYTYSAIVRELWAYMESSESCEHSEEETPKTNEPADDIECLELDIRTYNSLKQAGINKVYEIREKADELSNAMGKKFNDVLLAVAKYNTKKDNDKTLSSLKKHLDDAIVPCPFWNAELCGIVGNRKKSIAFRCEALHSVDVYDFIDADRVISECCNYTECADYYRQQLKHITTPPNEAWNMHTSIAELRRLCETYGSPDTIKNVVDSVMASDNAPVAVSAESTSVFDYTVLDDGIGDFLQKAEEQLKNEYMNFTANCGRIFAEAQERLAKHGFGENNGVFEKWIASMGFAKPTVYRMISIYNFRSSQIETNEGRAIFDALPKTLQADISAPSARPELVEQVMSGDITTHKEYIELKKKLERTEDDLRNVERNFDEREKIRLEQGKELFKLRAQAKDFEKQITDAEERAQYAESRLKSKSETISSLSEMNTTLEKRVKELESRPIDVAVDVDEVNRRVEEALQKVNSENAHLLAEERSEFAKTINAKDDKIWELEDKLKALEDKPQKYVKKIFAFAMTMDTYSKLIELIKKSKDTDLSKALSGAKIIDLNGKDV